MQVLKTIRAFEQKTPQGFLNDNPVRVYCLGHFRLDLVRLNYVQLG